MITGVLCCPVKLELDCSLCLYIWPTGTPVMARFLTRVYLSILSTYSVLCGFIRLYFLPRNKNWQFHRSRPTCALLYGLATVTFYCSPLRQNPDPGKSQSYHGPSVFAWTEGLA